MATLNGWREINISGKSFLIAHSVAGHHYIASGPVLTSEVVMGAIVQGGTVQTKSGTIYILENPLHENEDSEFARPLLLERAFRYFEKNSKILNIEGLEQLISRIDNILVCKKS